MNAVDILALFIGLENLFENRQQSAQNDVFKANDAQAEYLLAELNTKFDEQNAMLRRIIDLLEEILSTIS